MRSTRDRAVTSVIGMVLIIAVTIVAAMVIGVFVLDLAESSEETAPQGEFRIDWGETLVDAQGEVATIDYVGGDAIDSERVTVRGSGLALETSSKRITAGDTLTLVLADWDELSFERGETVDVVWDGHDSSAILKSFDVRETYDPVATWDVDLHVHPTWDQDEYRYRFTIAHESGEDLSGDEIRYVLENGPTDDTEDWYDPDPVVFTWTEQAEPGDSLELGIQDASSSFNDPETVTIRAYHVPTGDLILYDEWDEETYPGDLWSGGFREFRPDEEYREPDPDS